MLDSVIRWSIGNRFLVFAVSAVLLVAGGVTAISMPVDVFPDLTAPTVTVLAEAHGMAPEEVEALVTFPVETAVNGATGVRRVRSSTAQGISIVWVEFDWGTDIFRARQIVTEKLQLVAATLPAGVGPPVLAPITSIMGEIMLVAITGGPDVSPMDVRSVADWTVRRRLQNPAYQAHVNRRRGEIRAEYLEAIVDRLLRGAVAGVQALVAIAEGGVSESARVSASRILVEHSLSFSELVAVNERLASVEAALEAARQPALPPTPR